jgi:hypothetical protein
MLDYLLMMSLLVKDVNVGLSYYDKSVSLTSVTTHTL